jgi:hypothetical protein
MSNPASEKWLKATNEADAAFGAACTTAHDAYNDAWKRTVRPIEEARTAAIRAAKGIQDAIITSALKRRNEAHQAAWDEYRRTPEYEADQATRYLK